MIKTIVVLEGLNNKRKIENEAEIYTEVELSEENRHEVIHKKLPYFEFEDVKIYVPFFSKEFNVHYDTKLDSLTRPPFDSLKEDFDSSVINPFDTYGYKLFDSQFTRLVLIDEYKDEGVAVFTTLVLNLFILLQIKAHAMQLFLFLITISKRKIKINYLKELVH